MNIEEAKKLIDKQSIGKGGVGDIPVVKTHIVKVLLDQIDQPQPEVPRFVADWYEKHKDSLECDLYLYHMSYTMKKSKKMTSITGCKHQKIQSTHLLICTNSATPSKKRSCIRLRYLIRMKDS